MGHWDDQFSSGDQSHEFRHKLWESGFQKCPKCSKTSMKSTDHSAGCRMNGDGYGTAVFKCTECSWETSFQYDEAAETYYYETSGWKRKSDPAGWGVYEVQEWLDTLALSDHAKKMCRPTQLKRVNSNSVSPIIREMTWI